MLDRRRVELVSPDLPNQPYHHEAHELPLAEADALVARVRRSALDHAHAALALLDAEVGPAHRLVAMALRGTPFGEPPQSVAEVLAYRPLEYVADSLLYLAALRDAARAHGLDVVRHAKGREFAAAAERLGTAAAEIQSELKQLGAGLGPPWTAEHQQAAAAAIACLPSPT